MIEDLQNSIEQSRLSDRMKDMLLNKNFNQFLDCIEDYAENSDCFFNIGYYTQKNRI